MEQLPGEDFKIMLNSRAKKIGYSLILGIYLKKFLNLIGYKTTDESVGLFVRMWKKIVIIYEYFKT